MQSSTKISVIVVNYNGMPHIDTCISSVLSQTYTNYEVIFVDNCSTDDSLNYARMEFPGLIIVANDRNIGYAGAINSGLFYATGQYIAPLNMDTEVAPNWLDSMARFLDTNPLAAVVTPKILLFDEREIINTKGKSIHISGLSFCRNLGEKDNGSMSPERVLGISGCSYLIRREILQQMGGAPQSCFMSDDVTISWLLDLMGYEIYCVPEAVVFHKYALKMNPSKLFHLERERQTLLFSTLKAHTLAAYFPIFVTIELMILSYCLIKGKAYLGAKLRSMVSVWRDRDNIKRKRDQYRLLRKISDRDLFKKLDYNLKWAQLLHIVR